MSRNLVKVQFFAKRIDFDILELRDRIRKYKPSTKAEKEFFTNQRKSVFDQHLNFQLLQSFTVLFHVKITFKKVQTPPNWFNKI